MQLGRVSGVSSHPAEFYGRSQPIHGLFVMWLFAVGDLFGPLILTQKIPAGGEHGSASIAPLTESGPRPSPFQGSVAVCLNRTRSSIR